MMKAAMSASQFKSRYHQATAASSATVIAILMNSPMKKVIGLRAPGFNAPICKRNANKPFGNTQHRPPNIAEKKACGPAMRPASAAAASVVAN